MLKKDVYLEMAFSDEREKRVDWVLQGMQITCTGCNQ